MLDERCISISAHRLLVSEWLTTNQLLRAAAGPQKPSPDLSVKVPLQIECHLHPQAVEAGFVKCTRGALENGLLRRALPSRPSATEACSLPSAIAGSTAGTLRPIRYTGEHANCNQIKISKN